MSLSEGSVTVRIGATPDDVYRLVADVTRMGEWSPETTSCRWLGEPGKVGSKFRGRNRRGFVRWFTDPVVVAATPGDEFAFTTRLLGKDQTRWRYRFEPVDGGTAIDVTESFDAVANPLPVRLFERLIWPNRQQDVIDGMRTTLERLKVVAEG